MCVYVCMHAGLQGWCSRIGKGFLYASNYEHCCAGWRGHKKRLGGLWGQGGRQESGKREREHKRGRLALQELHVLES